MTHLTRLRGATAGGLFALGLLVVPVAAQPAPGTPAMINPAEDLLAQDPGTERGWFDSIYFTSALEADGRNIGVLLHTMTMPRVFGPVIIFSVTDETKGLYKSHMTQISPNEYSWDKTEFEITAPGLRWTGDDEKMSVSFEAPWGAIEFTLEAQGPALAYGGTGVFPLLGETNYEFALPNMATTGKLTLEGETLAVEGRSWLDRQWGTITPRPDLRWTWMNLIMPDGEVVAIWNALDSKAEESWATIMREDGSHEVVAVEPLARGAGDFWTSEQTGQKYPTSWRVRIPAVDADLAVDITGPASQESFLPGGHMARLEATATFSGTYRNEAVSGRNYVEMIGDWPR
ncbi:hydrolase [Chelativorans sp. ZYF759]|uniref:lipocalin family protein n=1 Tax=Chelativorans sp. ZYF759 TaxID=2692213 RepID=UPI00145CD9C6|nr:lipocalin family protein [Chelativorans sp. ZYF759]NMG41027.1 hydrolase [Chelativorans sp. ZYF759]